MSKKSENVLMVSEPLTNYQRNLFSEAEAFAEYILDEKGEKEFNFRSLCPEIPNTTYLTHAIHAYPAKFIPQIPYYVIKNLTKPGEYVLDPFCGSGTTLVEASLLGRHSYGIDLNPLGQLITEVKTTPICLTPNEFFRLISGFIKTIKSYKGTPVIVNFPNRDHWFDKKVQEDLGVILAVLEKLRLELPEAVYKFFIVCFSAIIRKVANADPGISKPFVSKYMRLAIKNGNRDLNTFKYLEEVLYNYAERVLNYTRQVKEVEYYTKVSPRAIVLKNSDARFMELGDSSVDLIVTSPPYANAQEYFRSIKLELFWLGMADSGKLLEFKKRLVGTEVIPEQEYRKLPSFGISYLDQALYKIYEVDPRRSHIICKYFMDMRRNIEEDYRVLKKNGYFCILVGDNVIRKVPIHTHKYIIEIAEEVGFKTVEIGYDRIKSRGLSPKRHHTAGLIEVEWLLIFKK